MITTLLIDLDDTLLINDVDRFIPAYLKNLGQFLEPIVPADQLIQKITLSTRAMMDKPDLQKTLAEVFDENFFPALGISKESLMPHFDAFYAEEFGKLQHLTKPVPAAQRFICYAIENQFDIVIATNPLFPLTAIEQRLDWAGVPASQYPYTLITSYETFHYAKPRLEYVTEILAKCGRLPYEAAMIGNDLLMDLPPAAMLGAAVFHVSNDPDGPYPCGDMDAAIQWLGEIHPESDPTQCISPETLLARLRGNFIAFNELEKMVHEDQWKHKPSPDAWAPIEVLCHLRDVEKEINYRRIKRILREHEPFLSAQDSDKWADERIYIEESPSLVYQDLIQTRLLTLSALEVQPPSAWERPARHAIFGPTKLSEIVRIFLEHDILHIRQIKETVAAITAME